MGKDDSGFLVVISNNLLGNFLQISDVFTVVERFRESSSFGFIGNDMSGVQAFFSF